MSSEMAVRIITYYGIAAVIASVATYFVASAKRRDAGSWAAWAFFLPPVLLLALLAPAASEQAAANRKLRQTLKRLNADD